MSGFDGLTQVSPGILGWSATHAGIGQEVFSHYLPGPRVAIDPIGADGLLEGLRAAGGLERILLSNRHHYRGSGELIAAFGCDVLAPEPGMHEFEGAGDGGRVRSYEWGERVAEGVTAHRVAAISPDDGALLIELDQGPNALALADAVIGWNGGLAFVPDSLMDDPERTRTGIRDALAGLLELDFDTLLLAHGPPVANGGRAELRAFVERPVSASFD